MFGTLCAMGGLPVNNMKVRNHRHQRQSEAIKQSPMAYIFLRDAFK